MAFATTSSAANRKPGANAQTAAPPQAQARPRPRRSSGKAWRPNAPGRKPGSGALAEPNSEFPRRRIVNLVQPWSKQAILRSLKAKTHDYLRYRKAHTRTTGKNVRFSLPMPRKTVCFDRQRPKQTVFRIARPARQPNPMPNKQHFHHRSQRAFRKCSRKLAAVNHDACASPPYHNYLAQTLPIPYANLADPFPDPYQSLPHSLHRKILVLPGEIL